MLTGDDGRPLSEGELADAAERLGRYCSEPLVKDQATGLVYGECDRCGFPHLMPREGMIPPCPWCGAP